MNVLVVTAHHDDLELGCGGTVARLVENHHRVVSLVMTHSGIRDPAGVEIRNPAAALAEAQKAAATLGYSLLSKDEDTFDIGVSNANVCKIMDVIEAERIDAIFTHWHGDTHIAHERVHRMVMHAARRVPSVFGMMINWYQGSQTFAPQVFVPLTEQQWRLKIRALKCYVSEYKRAGEAWVEYLDRQTLNSGVQLGVPRAEAFIPYKMLWPL
ncbi:MAG: PIG-L family deacetylase [Acidobacteriota bacterium]|nr:PIG-L family deacetylase [Acidobacteriota bacterium]